MEKVSFKAMQILDGAAHYSKISKEKQKKFNEFSVLKQKFQHYKIKLVPLEL